jgi:hypothetical protein
MLGAVVPFNNIASSLLMERSYFKTPPAICSLENPFQCESLENTALHCPSEITYQPPLPSNISLHGHYYSRLTSNEIDCSHPNWRYGCTATYCKRYLAGIGSTKAVMSIPYFMAVSVLYIKNISVTSVS